jgi:lysophospholipase L1-like esterase
MKLSIAISALAVVLSSVTAEPQDYYSDRKSDYYSDRKKLIEQTEKTADVVMLGDSITAICDWPLLLPTVDIVNHGIGNDTVAGVAERIDATLRAKPRLVFLMIGINDVMANRDHRPYRQIIAALHSVDLVLQSVLFTGREDWNEKWQAEWNDRIDALNREISDLCGSNPRCRYLDLNPYLAPNRALRHTREGDGLHLTTAGCQEWAKVIRPIINR